MCIQNLVKFCIFILIFRKFATELRLLIDVRIQFLFNILRMNRQNLTKFCIHLIIDTIKISIVRKFATEQRPLIDARIQCFFNILRMNVQNLTKFCKHIIIDYIYIGIVNQHFSQICNRVSPLIDVRIQFFLFTIL